MYILYYFFGVCCTSGIKLYLFWRGMLAVLSCCASWSVCLSTPPTAVASGVRGHPSSRTWPNADRIQEQRPSSYTPHYDRLSFGRWVVRSVDSFIHAPVSRSVSPIRNVAQDVAVLAHSPHLTQLTNATTTNSWYVPVPTCRQAPIILRRQSLRLEVLLDSPSTSHGPNSHP
jgi:hypothetical protein